jgi:hypothetical protein
VPRAAWVESPVPADGAFARGVPAAAGVEAAESGVAADVDGAAAAACAAESDVVGCETSPADALLESALAAEASRSFLAQAPAARPVIPIRSAAPKAARGVRFIVISTGDSTRRPAIPASSPVAR